MIEHQPDLAITRGELLAARELDQRGCPWCHGDPPPTETRPKCGWCKTKAKRTTTDW